MLNEEMEKGRFVQSLLVFLKENKDAHPIYMMLMNGKKPGINYDDGPIDVAGQNEYYSIYMGPTRFESIKSFKDSNPSFLIQTNIPVE